MGASEPTRNEYHDSDTMTQLSFSRGISDMDTPDSINFLPSKINQRPGVISIDIPDDSATLAATLADRPSSRKVSLSANVDSPYVNTEVYNTIMNNDNTMKGGNPYAAQQVVAPVASEDSPFINTDVFNKIMYGGKQDADSESSLFSVSELKPKNKTKVFKYSNSTSDILSATSALSKSSELRSSVVSPTSPMDNMSIRTSQLSPTSGISNLSSSEVSASSPFDLNSSSINTSDIRLMSIRNKKQ